MSHYPPSVLRLIKELSRLPGIGEKSAERLAMHILRAPGDQARNLAHSIVDLKEKVRLCSICFGLSDGEVCAICNDPKRDRRLVCVVEQPAEMVAIEKSGGFPGLYHVLQGALSPMDGVGPEALRIRELEARLRQGEIQELVIATGTNVEGDSTAAYLAEHLSRFSVKITRIASGVPIGGDLKYVDQLTLRRAMEGRHAL